MKSLDPAGNVDATPAVAQFTVAEVAPPVQGSGGTGKDVDAGLRTLAAALVGTFLGILLAYGFFAPLAGRMEALGEQEMVFFRAVAVAIVAINEGASPKDVVARSRRVVGTDCRPNQAELKQLFG